MKKLFKISSIALSFALLVSCSDSNSQTSDEQTMSWMKQVMETYYYWNTQMPELNPNDYDSPGKYFTDLLVDEDVWSFYTDDYPALQAELFDGNPLTVGYSLTPFYYNVDGDSIAYAVNYVYPNSPASLAGIERGDIIKQVNNSYLSTANYQDIYTNTTYSVQLASIENNSLVLNGESYDLTATQIDANPSIAHSVINQNGKKIGYYCYVGYVAGTDGAFNDAMEAVFADFKQQGIDELIVDVRYNGGGEISCAQQMTSSIVPSSNVASADLMIELDYNDIYTNYLVEEGLEEDQYVHFSSEFTNLDLSRVYFLTTGSSASASELSIIALQPYMDVKIVGESTYGKYTGMFVFPDSNEQWGIAPICMKYMNALGYTDFVDGLSPDIEVEDNYLSYQPLGDTNDPMIAAVLADINGINRTVTAASQPMPFAKRMDMPVSHIWQNNAIMRIK